MMENSQDSESKGWGKHNSKINGSKSASQAYDEGSIPFTRSMITRSARGSAEERGREIAICALISRDNSPYCRPVDKARRSPWASIQSLNAVSRTQLAGMGQPGYTHAIIARLVKAGQGERRQLHEIIRRSDTAGLVIKRQEVRPAMSGVVLRRI